MGVISAITPFNHPLNMVSHKVAPAIATNNCVVCKPTELTPLTAIALADILYEAGLPPEMFQVVTGWPADIGDEMVTNPNIGVITFTGGVRVGKIIAAKAGYKRAALELGGNDPLIVLDDLSDERSRQGGRTRGGRRHQEFRPALHGGEAHSGAGAGGRPLCGTGSGQGQEDQVRRSHEPGTDLGCVVT